MLQHAERVSGNVSRRCRFFGASRALFYIWKKRYEKNGVAGLRDLKRRLHHIRYRVPPELSPWFCGFAKNAVMARSERASTCNGINTLTFHRRRFICPFIVTMWVPSRRRSIAPGQNQMTRPSESQVVGCSSVRNLSRVRPEQGRVCTSSRPLTEQLSTWCCPSTTTTIRGRRSGFSSKSASISRLPSITSKPATIRPSVRGSLGIFPT